MHSLMSAGFLVYLFMNDFLPGCLFPVVMFYVWRECVMSVCGWGGEGGGTDGEEGMGGVNCV